MLQGGLILAASFVYLGLLFAVAYYGDRRADAGRSIISNPYFYALSLAVYCTAWTFYGSVGRAASTGLDFLTIYLGPTILAPLWWLIVRKMIRVSKRQRITSIADFIASRYGKSAVLGGAVTIVAVAGIVPYIALQLKAISTSFTVASTYPDTAALTNAGGAAVPLLADTALYVALLLALFTVLFGARHLDASERHEGMVAAVAFESLVKLVAFLAVGLFVTFGLYQGFGDLFSRAAERADLRALMTLEPSASVFGEWAWLSFLSMLAILFLPRQFQVAVVENVNEQHLKKGIWLFPLYLILINIFVLPIALAGMMYFPDGTVEADMFVLALPLESEQPLLAVLVFIGGLSAATAMVIVATTALATMVCNDLVMPVLLRTKALRLQERTQLTGLLLGIRRSSIVVVLLLSFVYFRMVEGHYTLVSIGLISFAAVAQFAPAILGGLYWKRGTHAGALWGLLAGFLVWAYTLPAPSFAEAGLLPHSFVEEGPWGWAFLHPHALFGLDGWSPVAHGLFWSLLVNVGLYVGLSFKTQPTAVEHSQARAFVDALPVSSRATVWRGQASVTELRQLLSRFLGHRAATQGLKRFANAQGIDTTQPTWEDHLPANARLMHHAEKLLTGAIGSASAHVVVGSVVNAEPLNLEEVMDILDETQQMIAHSRELERKKRELEQATQRLQAANAKLQELDRLKDDFISTVTHELRTPLTSIRAFSEIMYDNPDLSAEQRQEFLEVIIKEEERLTRLINQVLDLQKLEAEPMTVKVEPVSLRTIVDEAVQAMSQQMEAAGVTCTVEVPDEEPGTVEGDRDRLKQVLLNLLSNAFKFCDDTDGRIVVTLRSRAEDVQIDVADNGPGIDLDEQDSIFERFQQARSKARAGSSGSGLGLTIAQRIILEHNGDIWVESTPGEGATFSFTVPRTHATDPTGDGAPATPDPTASDSSPATSPIT